MTRLPCVAILLAVSTDSILANPVDGVVASVHPIATEAGIDALQAGGNAVDAAIATALTLGVVDGHNSGIGGGCFILLQKPNGKIVAIDGRERAPAAATRDMFLRNGKAVPELSQTGPLAIAVPGAIAAYRLALAKHGTRSLQDLMMPAAEIADSGYRIDRVMARNLHENAHLLSKFSGSRSALLKSDGSPYAEGDLLVQKDLARSYREIAKSDGEWFYKGEFARRIERWMQQNEGLIRASDFKNFAPTERRPIITSYREFEIVGFPPPSSGGIHVAQILNILEHFDLRAIHQENPIDLVHVVAEAMKLAFADRAHWLGDADFVAVPKGLIEKSYGAKLAKKIDPRKSSQVASYGLPPNWQTSVFGKHTTHVAAADRLGNWAAITATVNTSFGSKVIVPGTGIVLNNQMDDFSSQPGVPNAFGLLGAENNSIAPGKRPLSSMSPTIVLKDGRPILTLGAAGGPKIISQVVLTIIRHLDLQWSLRDAVQAARWHHQWRPDTLFVEQNMPISVIQSLSARGHVVERLESGGVLQAIGLTENGQAFTAVNDPRVPGMAMSTDGNEDGWRESNARTNTNSSIQAESK